MLGKKCSEELEGEIFFVARFRCFLYTGCEIKHQHWLLAIFETMFQSTGCLKSMTKVSKATEKERFLNEDVVC